MCPRSFSTSNPRETSDPGRPLFFDKHVGAASAPLPPTYRPRQPEKTVLHLVVRENLETMLTEARARTDNGFGYPRFVRTLFAWQRRAAREEEGYSRVLHHLGRGPRDRCFADV
jgi:hypothetical protein